MWATIAVEKAQGKSWGNSEATLKEQEGWRDGWGMRALAVQAKDLSQH